VSHPRPTFDLQSHSLHSDGALSPTEVVARAAQAGVTLLALTDHDTVDGVHEAVEEATRHDITVVPAAEISAVDATPRTCTSSATASTTATRRCKQRCATSAETAAAARRR
jgi:DNA polymerase III alpha subunit